MEIVIISTLLLIAAETTYLVYRAVRKERKTTLAPVFVDTSVLIDGRIIAIAESGFITRPLYIPRSVVGELQFLADNADSEKRTRARHGLDVINQLQSISAVKVVVFPDGVKADEGVDNRLLSLAKKHHGAVCTIDYNLNKVAVVEGIEVLNVNELAKSLRMAYLPGERMMIELSQKGNDQHQAVGHLSDGTMVVVEHAYKQIGSTVEVEFIRSLQTAAGKMMFAKLTQPNQNSKQGRAPKLPGEKKAVQLKATKRPQSTRKAAVEPSEQPQPQQRSVKRQGGAKRSEATQTATRANTQAAAKPEGQPAPRKRPSNNRRRSPEDSLMELVNQSDADNK